LISSYLSSNPPPVAGSSSLTCTLSDFFSALCFGLKGVLQFLQLVTPFRPSKCSITPPPSSHRPPLKRFRGVRRVCGGSWFAGHCVACFEVAFPPPELSRCHPLALLVVLRCIEVFLSFVPPGFVFRNFSYFPCFRVCFPFVARILDFTPHISDYSPRCKF